MLRRLRPHVLTEQGRSEERDEDKRDRAASCHVLVSEADVTVSNSSERRARFQDVAIEIVAPTSDSLAMTASAISCVDDDPPRSVARAQSRIASATAISIDRASASRLSE